MYLFMEEPLDVMIELAICDASVTFRPCVGAQQVATKNKRKYVKVGYDTISFLKNALQLP